MDTTHTAKLDAAFNRIEAIEILLFALAEKLSGEVPTVNRPVRTSPDNRDVFAAHKARSGEVQWGPTTAGTKPPTLEDLMQTVHQTYLAALGAKNAAQAAGEAAAAVKVAITSSRQPTPSPP